MGPVERAVLKDLSQRAKTALGQTALVLARQLDATTEPSPAAVVARELRLLLTELDRAAPIAARSGLDDLRARRAAREKATG